ncbi:MAG: L-2-amino-thiazoline-4-carboxylic acid hydrolase, partial [Oscillospiraceae bacterium]
MSYQDTKYNDLSSVCNIEYGDEQGTQIYKKSEQYFHQMINEADYRNSEIIKNHMNNNIFPVLAYYMSILDNGFDQQRAYDMVLQQTQKHANIQKEKNRKFGSMPFAFLMYRLAARKVMDKNFPIEGWETEWVRYDKQEVHFDLKRCLYFDVISSYGHPELCTVFCKNDITAFSGYLPKIR